MSVPLSLVHFLSLWRYVRWVLSGDIVKYQVFQSLIVNSFRNSHFPKSSDPFLNTIPRKFHNLYLIGCQPVVTEPKLQRAGPLVCQEQNQVFTRTLNSDSQASKLINYLLFGFVFCFIAPWRLPNAVASRPLSLRYIPLVSASPYRSHCSSFNV